MAWRGKKSRKGGRLSVCCRDWEAPCAASLLRRDQPSSAPLAPRCSSAVLLAAADALQSDVARRTLAAMPGNQQAKQKGRDSDSVWTPPRSGCGLSVVRSLLQHSWTVQAFFSFRTDIARLSAVLQPIHAMSGAATTQQLLWLMERPIRLYIFIKDCLVSSSGSVVIAKGFCSPSPC